MPYNSIKMKARFARTGGQMGEGGSKGGSGLDVDWEGLVRLSCSSFRVPDLGFVLPISECNCFMECGSTLCVVFIYRNPDL